MSDTSLMDLLAGTAITVVGLAGTAGVVFFLVISFVGGINYTWRETNSRIKSLEFTVKKLEGRLDRERKIR